MDPVLWKYSSFGNEYLVFDTFKNHMNLDSRTVQMLCSRNFASGSMGIIAGPSMTDGKMTMKVYQPDGSERQDMQGAGQVITSYLQDAGYLGSDSRNGRADVIGKSFLSEEYLVKNHFQAM